MKAPPNKLTCPSCESTYYETAQELHRASAWCRMLSEVRYVNGRMPADANCQPQAKLIGLTRITASKVRYEWRGREPIRAYGSVRFYEAGGALKQRIANVCRAAGILMHSSVAVACQRKHRSHVAIVTTFAYAETWIAELINTRWTIVQNGQIVRLNNTIGRMTEVDFWRTVLPDLKHERPAPWVVHNDPFVVDPTCTGEEVADGL